MTVLSRVRKDVSLVVRPVRAWPPDRPGLTRGRRVFFGLLVVSLIILGLGVPAASAATPKALINADTVSGGSSSAEALIATSLGFSVDVVDGPSWLAMTQAQFAGYQLLIAGDPTCGVIADSFSSNESTWAPVVMGTAVRTAPGNRILIGTDPVFHSGGVGPRAKLISSGLDFAGAQPGRTGLYFDSTCLGAVPDQAATMMAQLSTGTGAWTEDETPPCGGNVAKIASNAKFDALTTSDLEGWGCSVHDSFPTFASDWSALAVATDTTSHPTCGTDITVTPPVDACGEAYVLVAGSGIVVTAPDINLTPATGSDPAGGTHTVTASVTSSGAPVSGQLVTFTVTGQNNGVTGTCAPVSCVTTASGTVSFTYPDTFGAGTDTILASFTSGGTTQQASASEIWTTGTNTPPVAADQSLTTPQDTPLGLTLSATDAEHDPLTYAVVSAPLHGTLSGTAPNLTYTPTAGYTGGDSFTFRANDGSNNSNTGTITITVTPTGSCPSPAPVVDTSVSADRKTPSAKIVSPAMTTTNPGELLLAFVEADGPQSPTQKVKTVTGGGLAWTLAARSNSTWGTTEVWQAHSMGTLSGIRVTATLATAYDGSITVTAFRGALTHVGATAVGAGKTGTPSATLTTLGCNSVVWAAGHDWSHAKAAVPAAGQSIVHQYVDNGVHDSFWTQKVDAPITSAGTPVTVSDTGFTKDRWTLAAVEISAG